MTAESTEVVGRALFKKLNQITWRFNPFKPSSSTTSRELCT